MKLQNELLLQLSVSCEKTRPALKANENSIICQRPEFDEVYGIVKELLHITGKIIE